MIQPVREQRRSLAHRSFGSLRKLPSDCLVVCSQKKRKNCKMRVRFAVVLLLLLAALAHGDQQAAAKSAGMVMIIISKLHVQRTY